MDAAAYEALKSAGIRPGAAAGFSLGEYAAITAAGVLPFEETLRLVEKRAAWMQQASEEQDVYKRQIRMARKEEVPPMIADFTAVVFARPI